MSMILVNKGKRSKPDSQTSWWHRCIFTLCRGMYPGGWI